MRKIFGIAAALLVMTLMFSTACAEALSVKLVTGKDRVPYGSDADVAFKITGGTAPYTMNSYWLIQDGGKTNEEGRQAVPDTAAVGVLTHTPHYGSELHLAVDVVDAAGAKTSAKSAAIEIIQPFTFTMSSSKNQVDVGEEFVVEYKYKGGKKPFDYKYTSAKLGPSVELYNGYQWSDSVCRDYKLSLTEEYGKLTFHSDYPGVMNIHIQARDQNNTVKGNTLRIPVRASGTQEMTASVDIQQNGNKYHPMYTIKNGIAPYHYEAYLEYELNGQQYIKRIAGKSTNDSSGTLENVNSKETCSIFEEEMQYAKNPKIAFAVKDGKGSIASVESAVILHQPAVVRPSVHVTMFREYQDEAGNWVTVENSPYLRAGDKVIAVIEVLGGKATVQDFQNVIWAVDNGSGNDEIPASVKEGTGKYAGKYVMEYVTSYGEFVWPEFGINVDAGGSSSVPVRFDEGNGAEKAAVSVYSRVIPAPKLTNANQTQNLNGKPALVLDSTAGVDFGFNKDTAYGGMGTTYEISAINEKTGEPIKPGKKVPLLLPYPDGVTQANAQEYDFSVAHDYVETTGEDEVLKTEVFNSRDGSIQFLDAGMQVDVRSFSPFTVLNSKIEKKLKPEQTPAPIEEVIEKEKLDSVPKELAKTQFDTVKKIETGLKKEVEKIIPEEQADGQEVFDLVLYIEEGGQKRVATPEEIAAKGKITVKIPYPAGTSPETHDFAVAHMITVAANGMKPGDVETPTPIERKEYLEVEFKGLSPVIVQYKKEAPAPVPNDLPKTGDTSRPLAALAIGIAALAGVSVLLKKRK